MDVFQLPVLFGFMLGFTCGMVVLLLCLCDIDSHITAGCFAFHWKFPCCRQTNSASEWSYSLLLIDFRESQTEKTERNWWPTNNAGLTAHAHMWLTLKNNCMCGQSGSYQISDSSINRVGKIWQALFLMNKGPGSELYLLLSSACAHLGSFCHPWIFIPRPEARKTISLCAACARPSNHWWPMQQAHACIHLHLQAGILFDQAFPFDENSGNPWNMRRTRQIDLVNKIFNILQYDYGDEENENQIRLVLDNNDASSYPWAVLTFGVLRKLREEGNMPRPRMEIMMIQVKEAMNKIRKRYDKSFTNCHHCWVVCRKIGEFGQEMG